MTDVVGGMGRHDVVLMSPPVSRASARELYRLLLPDVKVFMAERPLGPGRVDPQLPIAQRASCTTVILIARDVDDAWYLADEIARAIELHRASPEAHRLVPVLLEPDAPVPYSLEHVQAINAAAQGGLPGVAAWLRELVTWIRGQDLPLPVVPTASACRHDHVRLYDRLSRLLPTQFEQIVFLAQIERGLIAPDTAPLADRILGLARLAEVDPDLCQRVSMLLDDRAPWTRRSASPPLGRPGDTRRKPTRRAPRKAGMDRFRRKCCAWRQGG
jgi:hypothetical protein